MPSLAGVITFKSSLGCEVTLPVVKARLELENNGDESAYNIQTIFTIIDKSCLSKVYPRLEVDKKLIIECLEDLEGKKKGVYPLIAKIHFQDAAGYPFSTVVVTPFTYIKATTSHVFGKLEDITLSDKNVLKLNVVNTAHSDLNLDITILVPDELSLKPSQKRLILKARTKEEILFRLSNFSALAGAVYPAWAIIEYESQDNHFTYLCTGDVKIRHKANIFKKYWRVSLILITIMMILFIWLNLRKKSH